MNNIYKIEHNTNSLFNTIPDTGLIKIIENSYELLNFKPDILDKISEDQDRLARKKKKLRIEDKIYYWKKNRELPGFNIKEEEINANELELLAGRERMSSQTVYLFMMVRGDFKSVTSSESVQRIHDSLTLNIILSNWNIKMPGATTILENLNCITNETREYILDCQIEYVLKEGLENFKELIIDSTHVEANTEWPTDGKILLALLNRAFHYSQKLSIFGLPDFKKHWMPAWLDKIKHLTDKINMTCGKKKSQGKIKKYYSQTLKTAQKAHDYLIGEIEKADSGVSRIDICPSMRYRLKKVWNLINNDVLDSAKVLYYTHNRVINGIVLKASEKILSISDRSASFIKKGNRNPVIGYKPQIIRSGNGFIPFIKVPEGNTSDALELIPAVKATIERTKVTPRVMGTDDGYASEANREELKEMGIAVVSMKGSKGKKITPVRSWDSKAYEEARNKRSAVESLIFSLKYSYEFGDVRRRGIEAVTAELLEKVIVYNLTRVILIREKQKQQMKQPA